MKTSTLIGQALNWAVAKCEFPAPDYCEDDWLTYVTVDLEVGQGTYSPSTDWAQGGPIIEQEALTICTQMTRFDWQAIDFHGDITQFGPTPLIAAMRCYVASKIGNEINIPKELT